MLLQQRGVAELTASGGCCFPRRHALAKEAFGEEVEMSLQLFVEGLVCRGLVEEAAEFCCEDAEGGEHVSPDFRVPVHGL